MVLNTFKIEGPRIRKRDFLIITFIENQAQVQESFGIFLLTLSSLLVRRRHNEFMNFLCAFVHTDLAGSPKNADTLVHLHPTRCRPLIRL